MISIELLYVVNCILSAGFAYVAGMVMYKKSFKFSLNLIWAVVLYLGCFYIRINYFPLFFSIFFSYLMYVMFLKIVFKQSLFAALLGGIITYTIRMIVEVLIVVSGWQIDETIETYHVYTILRFYLNTITAFISILIFSLFRKYIRIFYNYINSLSIKHFLVVGAVYVDILIVVLFRVPYIKVDYDLFADLLLMFMLTGVSLISVNKDKQLASLSLYYDEMFKYSQSNEALIMKYRMAGHENKNHLLIIRGLIDCSKKELKNYVNELLADSKELQGVGFADLKYLLIPGMSNFINYKLMTMQDMGAIIEVNVSREVENLEIGIDDNKKLNDLYTILGVILDNMIDSILICQEKVVSVQLYVREDVLCAEFANSFSGKIDLDKIQEANYSTKGSQRGIGLALVNQIIKRNLDLTVETKIVDKFFVQSVRVKLNKTKNHV